MRCVRSKKNGKKLDLHVWRKKMRIYADGRKFSSQVTSFCTHYVSTVLLLCVLFFIIFMICVVGCRGMGMRSRGLKKI